MDYIIFPDEEKVFLENLGESFSNDFENGLKMFYQMYLKLKSTEKENQKLKEVNENLNEELDDLKLSLKAMKKRHEKFECDMVKREDDLLKQIEVISLQPVQRTSKYSELKEIKDKMQFIQEENERLEL